MPFWDCPPPAKYNGDHFERWSVSKAPSSLFAFYVNENKITSLTL